MKRHLASSLFLLCAFILFGVVPVPGQQDLLGEPPVWSPDMEAGPPPEPSVAGFGQGLVTGGFTVDPSYRENSRTFYNDYYKASDGISVNWTGSRSTCNAGTISSTYLQATLLRINYYRAMAGVPANVVFNSTYNAKDQQMALMIVLNGLSHSPPATWKCYTADGAEAAGKSNLSIGWNMDNIGPTAVNGQFKDKGVDNYFVGHRRWLLYPMTKTMGSGSVPMVTGCNTSGCAIWVMDGTYGTTRPSCRDGFVAWPPPGYTPYTVVYPRWSFSYPGADFSTASISMTKDGGGSVSVTKETVNSGNYGERTIVWRPFNMSDSSTWPKPTHDSNYTVNVTGVKVGGSTYNFSYNVSVFDPAVAPWQSPYPAGVPWPIPGRIDVEDYDRGGESVAYHDTGSQNLGGAYRTSEGVDVSTLPNTVTCVGWTAPGEWLEYTINSAGGTYRGVISFASLGPGGQFRVLFNGSNLFGKNFTIPDTGGWDAFVWRKTSAVVSIPAGKYTLRLEMMSAGSSGGVGNLNYLKFDQVTSLKPEKQAGRTTGSPRPIQILTSNRGTGVNTNGWLTVDGDLKTGWKGAEGARGWWMAFAYDRPILVNGVDIRFGENSPTNVLYLGSLELLQWFDLSKVWSARAAGLEYLWMIFPDDGTGRSPDVREVQVK